MSKFFKNPQLGQAQLDTAQRSLLPTEDVQAKQKAQQAAKSIDMLSGMAQTAISSIGGIYSRNIEEKDRIASANMRGDFVKHVQSEIENTKDFEYISDEGLKQKYKDFSDSFLEKHKDKPFIHQLRSDLEKYSTQIVPSMYQQRDAISTEKVSNYTAQVGLDNSSRYSQGLMSDEAFLREATQLIESSTEALQTPSSSSIPLTEEQREVGYKGLLRKDARQAYLKGVAISLAKPENSRLAKLVQTKEFMDVVGVDETDEDYKKLVSVAIRKGMQADKVNYENALSSFSETLYSQTNQGVTIDIDLAVSRFREAGNDLTAKDEYRIRKQFGKENKLVIRSNDYQQGLLEGVDRSVNLPKKQREELYHRTLSDVLGTNGQEMSIKTLNGALSSQQGQVAFSSYIKSGGKLPDSVTQMFDVPAGASAQKWEEADAAILRMQAAALGSGQSVEQIIGVKEVSKIRGMSRLLRDETMDEATKKNAIEALQSRAATFNTKGYIKSDPDDPVDKEWLQSIATDAPWTTDDFVSDRQNADEILGNYNAYRLAGMSEKEAKKAAEELFEKSNRAFEMPDGGEIIVPKKHEYLNQEGIIEFAKSERFKSLMEQRADLEATTGQGWIADWRFGRNISIQKAHDFGKTQRYNMLYDGKLVKDATFTYDEYDSFINSPMVSSERRKEIIGVYGSREQLEMEALDRRREVIEEDKERRSAIDRIKDIYDIGI